MDIVVCRRPQTFFEGRRRAWWECNFTDNDIICFNICSSHRDAVDNSPIHVYFPMFILFWRLILQSDCWQYKQHIAPCVSFSCRHTPPKLKILLGLYGISLLQIIAQICGWQPRPLWSAASQHWNKVHSSAPVSRKCWNWRLACISLFAKYDIRIIANQALTFGWLVRKGEQFIIKLRINVFVIFCLL